MNADTARATVRDFLARLHAGDAPGALAYCTASPRLLFFTKETPGGIAGFASAVSKLYKDGPHREFVAQFVDGDTVLSQITVRGTTNKDEKYENSYLVLCHFSGAKIDTIQHYFDSAYASTKFAI